MRDMAGSSVIRLLFTSGPAAIRRFIASIVVYTVKGHSGFWHGTHIMNEQGKVVEPSGTDSYSAPSVPVEIAMAFPQTASLHGTPRVVLRASFSSMLIEIAHATSLRRLEVSAWNACTTLARRLNETLSSAAPAFIQNGCKFVPESWEMLFGNRFDFHAVIIA